jgi:acetylornithine deacetylase
MASVKELQDKVLAELDDDEIVAFHRASVRIPSVTGNEKQYAEFLYGKMEEFGFDDRGMYDARGPDRPNIWGLVRGSGGGPSLLLENHTDTVPVEGWEKKWKGTPQENPFSGEIVEGEIWGRGSLDNKAGMTSSMMVMKALKKSGVTLKGDVVLSGTIDEEGASDDSSVWGMKAMAKEYNAGKVPRADFSFWTDCSDGLHIYVSQYALCVLEIKIKGETAYPGTPWLGTNAITKAQRFLELLDEYADQQWKEKYDPLQGRPNNVVMYINGGHPTQLAVPEECTIVFLRWGIPGDEPQRMYRDVESILRYLAMSEGLDFEIKVRYPGDTGYGYSSVGVPEDHPAVKMLAKSLEIVTGKKDMVTGAPYVGETPWMISGMDLPTLYFGPGPLGWCHTLEERCPIGELLQHAKVLALSVVEYCSG